MFELRNYIKEGFLKAIGKMSEYQIILNSADWCKAGVLTESDLAEIKQAIENRHARYMHKHSANEEASEKVAEDAPNDN